MCFSAQPFAKAVVVPGEDRLNVGERKFTMMHRFFTATIVLPFLMALLFASPVAAEPSAAITGSVQVNGLTCPICVAGLQKKLRSIAWVQSANVFIDDGRADFTVRSGTAPDIEQLRATVKRGGFTARRVTLTATGRVERADSEVWLVSNGARIAIEAGSKRTELLRKLGSSRRVRVTGTAETRGNNTELSIRSYRVL
ncbi:hypothetical protein JYT28_00240 [Desulfobulbus sp. AH-315-M07]|nr:hypothetical protein [Desulfobulbus sp. AH-315-M07]